MAPRLRVCISEATDPVLNLAIENHLFRSLEPGTRILLMWRNDPSVILGRHQNPWIECDLRAMDRDGVPLVRRQSGGGTVFHDRGNSNFSFLASSDLYDRDVNFGIAIDALSRIGIAAERSPRNDILVDRRKVSGNAFKHTRERSFHHGTLLISADLDRLTAYLTPRSADLQSKGIRSVRSTVANLTEFSPGLTHERAWSVLAEAFSGFHGVPVPVERLDTMTITGNLEVDRYRREIASWEWRYGNTPDFVQRIQGRVGRYAITVELSVKKAVVDEAQVIIEPVDGGAAAIAGQLKTLAVGARYDCGDITERAVRTDALRSANPEQQRAVAWFVEEVR